MTMLFSQVAISSDPKERDLIIEQALDYISTREIGGFLGLHEGTVEDFSLESFDVGEADSKRDWISQKATNLLSVFYFDSLRSAKKLYEWLCRQFPNAQIFRDSIEGRDWNQKWRESFRGVDVPPFWKIRPSWNLEDAGRDDESKMIHLDPSFGFGFGNHPTTWMCLEFIGEQSSSFSGRALDFGSGSGILSVAMAKMGAQVDAVEIDDHARESSLGCLQANKVSDRVKLHKTMSETEGRKYNGIVSNIISSVLIMHKDDLVSRLLPSSFLFLSGILVHEKEEVLSFYEESFKTYELNLLKTIIKEKDSWLSFTFYFSEV